MCLFMKPFHERQLLNRIRFIRANIPLNFEFKNILIAKKNILPPVTALNKN